jgi:hypothetical protein
MIYRWSWRESIPQIVANENCDIYGPAHDVKGGLRCKTRLGTDAVIYPASQ